MFDRTSAGVDCTSDATNIMKHEIGHLFGLADAGSGCSGSIMGNVNGAIDTGTCEEADSNYLTTEEIDAGEDDDGGGLCGT